MQFTRTVPLPIQIVDVLDLTFKGQRFESNTVSSSYVKCGKGNTHSSLKRQNGLYQSAQCQGVSGVEADYAHRQGMSLRVSLV